MARSEKEYLVPWQALWPARCPGCDYLWQGLVEARCPECGERVEDGEVVIVGIRPPKEAREYISDSWVGDFFVSLFACGAVGGIGWWLGGFKLGNWQGIAEVFLLLNLVSLILWRQRRIAGYPPWVLHMHRRGYRLGAGDRIGRWTAWPKGIRVEAIRRKEWVEFRGVQKCGPLVLSTAFEVKGRVTEEQVRGVIERLQAWGGERVEVRGRGWF